MSLKTLVIRQKIEVEKKKHLIIQRDQRGFPPQYARARHPRYVNR
jgi:hypothetical protein